MSNAFLVIDGKTMQFDSIEQAQAYMKEHNITNVEMVNLDYQPLKKEIPDECYHKFEMLEPRIPMFAPMSGQENRRARRAAERKKRK